MIKAQQSPLYSIYCCSIPASGHAIPLLKVASALSKRGHIIIYATSSYQVPKLKQKYPEFQYVELSDDAREADFSKMDTKGPPLQLYYQSWLPGLRKSLSEIKPDIILADTFSIAAMEVAEEQKIKLAINCGLSLGSLVVFGVPNLNENFGVFGLTVIKPNIGTLFLHKNSELMKRVGGMLTRHMCITHSFIGFDEPVSVPPNIKLIGLAQDQDQDQPIPGDIQRWLSMIKSRDLGIIYVTFGSILTATQEFVNYLYYGLKKTKMAVIWSLRANDLPEQNELFLVRKWLPQKELLKLPQVKIVITHGGFGGVTEVLEAEKPMLTMPVFGDQPRNAQRIQELGIGITLRLSPDRFGPRRYELINFTHEELIEKVNKLLIDPNYEIRIRRLKKIGQRGGGITKACEWVEYAIQNGYEHLVDKSMGIVANRNPFNLLKFVVIGLLVGGIAYVASRNRTIPSEVPRITKR